MTPPIGDRAPAPALHWVGLLYRALNPRWAAEPLSGEGARRHGGRFNRPGRSALYTATHILTALREAGQVGEPLQPTTLVSYDADLWPIFDATDPVALASRGVAADMLAADDWRLGMLKEGVAPTQALAEEMISEGYAGMLTPSYARGAPASATNLVLWRWGGGQTRLTLNDSDHRLG
ncbi:RES family NAD+ phosphorylase [Phaeovulum sp.]|uniref:RES family NAD+ phosphorylase n=1 Tax=Phaeovulum sp. TaxID=2934796 RepID=UPI0039E4AFD1